MTTPRKYPPDAPVAWVQMCRIIAHRNGVARRPKVKRYPLQPLLDALGMTLSQMNQQASMNGEQYRSVRDRGLTEKMADRLCVLFGLHPMFVWPDWLADLEVECANDRCDVRFVPSRRGMRYCSKQCSRRVWDRRMKRQKYQSDPEAAARQRAKTQAYRKVAARAIRVKEAEYRRVNAERIRARRRAYYLANRERELARQREYDRAKSAARREAA